MIEQALGIRVVLALGVAGADAPARVKSDAVAASHAYAGDSGEGRWTVQESIDVEVPAPVITLSLQQRFRSRQDVPFGARMPAAMRNGFGGSE